MTPFKKTAQGCKTQQKIRNTIFRLLKIRERSIKEITDKLKSKNYSNQEINAAIIFFKDNNLLNDKRFAQQWIQWRLSKPFGLKRIAIELKIKGIAPETIQEELKSAKETINEEKMVRDLIECRLPKYKNIERSKVLQRLYGYLSRRGFSPMIINKILYQLKNKIQNQK